MELLRSDELGALEGRASSINGPQETNNVPFVELPDFPQGSSNDEILQFIDAGRDPWDNEVLCGSVRQMPDLNAFGSQLNRISFDGIHAGRTVEP